VRHHEQRPVAEAVLLKLRAALVNPLRGSVGTTNFT
jgi:hypothetical protein